MKGVYGQVYMVHISILPTSHESVASVTSNPATLWPIAHQAPLSMGFSRQEYLSGLPCPPLGDLPYLEIKPTSPASPALQILYQLSHQGL